MAEASNEKWTARARLYAIDKVLDELLPETNHREQAAACAVRMIEAWKEIHTNWSAEDLGLADTPEEREKWEAALIAAGEGIVQLAGRLVE